MYFSYMGNLNKYFKLILSVLDVDDSTSTQKNTFR